MPLLAALLLLPLFRARTRSARSNTTDPGAFHGPYTSKNLSPTLYMPCVEWYADANTSSMSLDVPWSDDGVVMGRSSRKGGGLGC